MKSKFNSPSMWDRLLSNDKYLSDFNTSVELRCKYAVEEIVRNKENHILNIGAGQGYLERMYFSKPRRSIDWVSLDISQKGLKKLKHYPLKTVLGFAHNIPFQNATFDVCVCMEMLEHIPKSEVSGVYREIRRILKPKGRLVVSVPVYEPSSLIHHPVGHVRKYTPEEIKSEITCAKFKIESERYLYSFNENYLLKSMLGKFFHARRPSIIFMVCRKV